MNRATGVQGREAGLATRFMFWTAKRSLRRVPTGMRVRALDPKLLRASIRMDFYGASQRLGFRAAEGTSAAESRDDGRMPILNRHSFCREQKSGNYRGAAPGYRPF